MNLAPVLAETTVTVNVGEVIGAFGTLLVVLGVPTFLTAIRSRRTAEAVHDVKLAATRSETAATASQKQVGEVAEQLRPENGRRLAQIVEQTGRLLEVVDGRLHDVSKRVDDQGREIEGIRVHTSGIEQQLLSQGDVVGVLVSGVDELRGELTQHMNEVAPMLELGREALRAKEQGTADGDQG